MTRLEEEGSPPSRDPPPPGARHPPQQVTFPSGTLSRDSLAPIWGPWESVLGLAVLPPDGKAVNRSLENRGSLSQSVGVFKTTDQWKPGL